jgi:hypothetical protein
VVAIVEQRLEGPVTTQMIQKFHEQETQTKQQVEVAGVKIEAFGATFPRPE